MSKHSIRRGSAGRSSTPRSVSSASNADGRAVAEVRLIRQRGIARRQVEQAALLAALRHHQPDAAPGALATARLRAPRVRRRPSSTAMCTSGGAIVLGVELLQRRRQHLGLRRASRPARRHRCRRRRRVPRSLATSSTRSTTRPRRIWKTSTTPPDGADLQRRTASRSPSAGASILLRRSRERLDRPDGVAQVRRALEPLLARPRPAISSRRPSTSSSWRPSISSRACSTARPVLLDRADRLDARREAALDVVLEAGPIAPAVDDLVARPDAEQPVRQAHRPARHATPA